MLMGLWNYVGEAKREGEGRQALLHGKSSGPGWPGARRPWGQGGVLAILQSALRSSHQALEESPPLQFHQGPAKFSSQKPCASLLQGNPSFCI